MNSSQMILSAFNFFPDVLNVPKLQGEELHRLGGRQQFCAHQPSPPANSRIKSLKVIICLHEKLFARKIKLPKVKEICHDIYKK